MKLAKIKKAEILAWLYDHQTAWEDFCTYFDVDKEDLLEKLQEEPIYFTGSEKTYKRVIYTDGEHYYVKWYGDLIEVEDSYPRWKTVKDY